MSALVVSEAEWQGTVVDLLRALGYRSMHVRRSRGKGMRHTTSTSVAGWPDLVAWRPGRFVALEVKSEAGRATADQVRVLGELEAAGVECRVARPSDFDELAGWLR